MPEMPREPIDDATIARAQKWADEHYPLPKRMPIEVAVLAVILGFVVAFIYNGLDRVLPRGAAQIATIALVALGAYLDTRQKWNLHSRAVTDAIERYRYERER